MAYLDIQRRPSPASMAAVIVIHGAIGAALIFGLTMTGVIRTPDRPITTLEFKKPPPPPEPTRAPEQAQRPDSKISLPIPPIPIADPMPPIDTTTELYPSQPPSSFGAGDALKPAIPSPAPSFKPIGAKPRNDPGSWVGTDDYRSNWIRQEMMGRARFRLDIASDGRVTNCTITSSSGYPALDQATCALVSKRAKFQPARGNEGQPVAGSYANTIDWKLPE